MQARAAYGDSALYINVEENPDKFDEMLQYSGGKTQVPVIIDGDKATIGFLGDVSLGGGIPIFGAPDRWTRPLGEMI
jgi:glutaredoxin 3